MPPVNVRRKAGEWARANKDAPLVAAFLAGYEYFLECHALSASEAEVATVDFLTAWNLYDRKDAKQNAIKAWRKLSKKEQEQALRHIPHFVRAHSDKRFRPMLATYLNQKRFLDDEIINTADNNAAEQQQSRLSTYAETIANYR